MKEFTFEDIKEFIYSQPDEKEVDFGQNAIHYDCGCLMVQFGKHHNIDFTTCDWLGVELYNHKSLPQETVMNIVDAPWKINGICDFFVLKDGNGDPYNPTTYKELKQVLKNLGY